MSAAHAHLLIVHLPVIACPIGAIEAVVVDGETGIIVASHDIGGLRAAVTRLQGDESLLERMGRRAEARCREMFTIEATAPRWLAVFRKLSEGRE